MATVPHESPERAHDHLASADRAGERETLLPTGDEPDDPPASEPPGAPVIDIAGELAALRVLGPDDLPQASLAELLFYGLAEPDGEGMGGILRAARDDLRSLADLSAHAGAGNPHVVLGVLPRSLDGIVRRLDVVIELFARTPRSRGAEVRP